VIYVGESSQSVKAPRAPSIAKMIQQKLEQTEEAREKLKHRIDRELEIKERKLKLAEEQQQKEFELRKLELEARMKENQERMKEQQDYMKNMLDLMKHFISNNKNNN